MDTPEFVTKVEGKDALTTLETLRRTGRGIPVLLGDQEECGRVLEGFTSQVTSFESRLRQAQEIVLPQWFQQRVEDDPEYYAIEPREWPAHAPPPTAISAHLHLDTKLPKREVYLAHIPVQESWMVPAFLNIGGWNECPAPEEHAAIWRYWQEHYAAHVVSMTEDTIELAVHNPPTTREQALRLAHEHMVYCADIVFQGVESLEWLAATLLNAHVWFFWWD